MNFEGHKYANHRTNFKNIRILSRYFKPRIQLEWYYGGKIKYIQN